MKKILIFSILVATHTLYAEFDFGECTGSKTFEQEIHQFADYDDAVIVGEIPSGLKGLHVELSSDKDVDIRLYGENDDKIVHWPYGILKESKLETKPYKNVPITYSGYNGTNREKGHEFIDIKDTTPTDMTMKVFGYKAGYATVNYSWTGKEGCKKGNGTGHFQQDIPNKDITVVGSIPKDVENLEVNLTSDQDIDIQLYGEDGTAIVAYPDGKIDGPGQQNFDYHNMHIQWSGYNGVNGYKGHEYIKITGKTTETITIKVYAYKAGTASVSYSWKVNKNIEIIKHITKHTFDDDNRTFLLKYGNGGTVASNCGTLTPSIITANVETAFKFTNIDVGTYKDCTVTITDANGNVSNPATLEEFTFFKVLNTTQLRGRSDGKGLDYVILADGFKADEMDVFRAKAREYANYILDYDSNLSLERNAWNIFTVETVSKESGADNIDGQDGTKVDTALDSYFWCGGTSRLLCIDENKASAVTAKYVPQFDKVLVITNSSKYGGAGGEYATTSLGGGANVVVHELGHSLAGLADEYADGAINPPSLEPSQPNVTINNDISTVKWLDWVGTDEGTTGNVGLYEGGLFVSEGVWRPTSNSIMRVLGEPFYAVNREAWALAVYHTAGVTYSHTPASNDVSQTKGMDTNFTIEPSMGAKAQKVIWQVDDVNQSVADNNFNFIFGAKKNVAYNVKAIISDHTGVIRKDPNNYSSETIEWNVTIK